MNTNDRRYLKMLIDSNCWVDVSPWLADRGTCITRIYTQWLRDGEFTLIKEDNDHWLSMRKRERE